jgi:hypothetical protein
MEPIVARNAEDAAFDKWLRADLRAQYGAVAAAPVPHDLIRLVRDHQPTARAAPAPPSRSWGAEDNAPAVSLAVAVLVSGLSWAMLAGAAQTLQG